MAFAWTIGSFTASIMTLSGMTDSHDTHRLDAFQTYRKIMNRRILEEKNHLGIKRFFNLDDAAYR